MLQPSLYLRVHSGPPSSDLETRFNYQRRPRDPWARATPWQSPTGHSPNAGETKETTVCRPGRDTGPTPAGEARNCRHAAAGRAAEREGPGAPPAEELRGDGHPSGPQEPSPLPRFFHLSSAATFACLRTVKLSGFCPKTLRQNETLGTYPPWPRPNSPNHPVEVVGWEAGRRKEDPWSPGQPAKHPTDQTTDKRLPDAFLQQDEKLSPDGLQKEKRWPDAVAHACNPSTLGGRGGRIT
ncbi:hypothetical protein AAY473_029539 [Plecturocebus cupreus]